MRGLYVYGIVDEGALEAPPRSAGVDPGHRPWLFDAAGLTAIVGDVDVGEFEGEALERNLTQPDWLEAKVRGHELVLDEVVATATVVPMRFGSIFSSADGLRSMLEENAVSLKESLERVRGRVEWGVRVHCARGVLVDQLAGPPAGHSTGRDYLVQRRARLQAEASAGDEAARVGAEVHGHLAALADAATSVASRQDPRSAVILNGAYLVHESRREEFMRCVEQLEKRHANAFVFEVTGPWPPYNFTSADVAGPRA